MADFRRGALFSNELNNPAVRDRLMSVTNAEVGGQGPQAQQAFMESIFNRAAARGQPLSQTLQGSYFPPETHIRAARGVNDAQRGQYQPILDSVLADSNVANYATGNASGTVGFNGGPQTYAANGERYGVEGPDRSWATSMGFTGGGPSTGSKMAYPQDEPSLGSRFIAGGPGALFGGGDPEGGFDWSRALAAASVGLGSISHPEVIKTLPNILNRDLVRDKQARNTSHIVDGRLITIDPNGNLVGNKPIDGAYTQAEKQADQDARQQQSLIAQDARDRQKAADNAARDEAKAAQAGQKTEDTTFAKSHVAFKANGGFEGAKAGIDKLRGIAQELRNSENNGDILEPTGRVPGLLGDRANSFLNPKALELKNRAWDAFQSGARSALGSQYTEKEGRAYFESNYDTRLSPSINAANLEKKANALERAARAQQGASDYFEKNGKSLKGFTYAQPTFDNLDDSDTPAPQGGGNSSGYKILNVR